MKTTGLLIILLIMVSAVAFTEFPQQDKNKGKKEQGQQKGKKADKPGKADAIHPNRDQQKEHSPANMIKEKGNADHPGMQKENNGHGNGNGNNGKLHPAHGNDAEYGYTWTRENFYDRNQYRKGEKVTICHSFHNADEPNVTLHVSVHALKAHMDHGDTEGTCPDYRSDRYSDSYLQERNDYYDQIQQSREQILYSRSILDYALDRLAQSRLQLADMRNNNYPAADIERKQVVVLELEKNASLLETLIGVTANVIANKLQ